MSRERTAPLTQPIGWEKSTKHLDINCTETELLLWKSAFGKGQVSNRIREAANREVCRLIGIKADRPPLPVRPNKPMQQEIARHLKRLTELARQSPR